MILSPSQLHKLGGAKFATDPVCVGAFKYGNRVAGDHITLDKSPYYYDRDKVHLKRQIIFKIITDGPVRASNLRSGDVDVAERLAALRRRLDQGRPEHPPADDAVARLPGDHGQHRQRGRHREAVPARARSRRRSASTRRCARPSRTRSTAT